MTYVLPISFVEDMRLDIVAFGGERWTLAERVVRRECEGYTEIVPMPSATPEPLASLLDRLA